jgi:hypothetical protein
VAGRPGRGEGCGGGYRRNGSNDYEEHPWGRKEAWVRDNICTKKIREKRDREVKKAWKGSNAWADAAMMGNRQQKNGMKSGGKELPLE